MYNYLMFAQRLSRRALGFIILSLHFSICFSQTNLVPNASFEQYNDCPNRIIQRISKHLLGPSIWYKPDRGGGGYLNACANNDDTLFGVPNNYGLYHGYQYARSGNGYIVMFFWNGSDAYNYFQVKLLDSLHTNKKYYAEHFVNLENDSRIACNNQGLLFTKNPIYVDTISTFPRVYTIFANPQIENKQIIQDTFNWVKVAGVFTATGGEQYLTIGNFRKGTQTAFRLFQSFGYGGAAYLVDDVAVYDLDSFHLKADAGRDTTIAKGDSVFIGSYTNGIDTIKWLQNGTTVVDTTRPGFWIWPTANTYYVLTQTVGGFTSSDTVYINVSTLPVKFISFSATLKENKVENSWHTANEINVNSYLIEKSTDGKAFYMIGKVGAENKARNSYTFTDENVSEGVSYYRVLALDNDGKRTYNGVQRIVNNYQQNALVIYPNPADKFANVGFENINDIVLLDLNGKVVATYNGIGLKQINTTQLRNGIYLVKAIAANGLQTNNKIIIQH